MKATPDRDGVTLTPTSIDTTAVDQAIADYSRAGWALFEAEGHKSHEDPRSLDLSDELDGLAEAEADLRDACSQHLPWDELLTFWNELGRLIQAHRIDTDGLVHNHDLDPTCPESVTNGRLRGACIDRD